MNGAFAIDASVAFSWIYPVQASEYTDKLLDRVGEGAEVVVPALWPLEVANATLIAVRRRRMTVLARREGLEFLGMLNIAIDMDSPNLAFGRISELAERHGLTIYDASYLEMAVRKTLPLATQDQPLRRAARTSGVELL